MTDESDNSGAEHALVCPFLTDNPTYAAGVEFGLLWAELRFKKPKRHRQYIREDNEEQVRVAASRLGYEVVKLEPWEDGWIFVSLRRR